MGTLKTARQVPVRDLRPGMVTLDWTVLAAPVQVGRHWVVDMRHRVDGGESSVHYALDATTTVVEVAR